MHPDHITTWKQFAREESLPLTIYALNFMISTTIQKEIDQSSDSFFKKWEAMLDWFKK
jgi:hypothetical protein